MEKVTLCCDYCATDFEKRKAEYTRRKNAGAKHFFCSRSCTGKAVVKNFKIYGKHPDNITRLKKMSDLSREVGTKKFTIEERPFAEYCRSARSRKKEYDIDPEYLAIVWSEQNGKCAISNIPLQLKSNGDRNPNTQASLDRIDSSKGYLRGNVQFISCALNLAKGARSDESLRELLQLIVEYQ